MSVLMINMLTTIWMSTVDGLEGAIAVTVRSQPQVPRTLHNAVGR